MIFCSIDSDSVPPHPSRSDGAIYLDPQLASRPRIEWLQAITAADPYFAENESETMRFVRFERRRPARLRGCGDRHTLFATVTTWLVLVLSGFSPLILLAAAEAGKAGGQLCVARASAEIPRPSDRKPTLDSWAVDVVAGRTRLSENGTDLIKIAQPPVISGDHLVKLLTSISGAPIILKHGYVTGPVDLGAKTVVEAVRLQYFNFDSPINAVRTNFKQDLVVRNSIFAGEVDLTRAVAHGLVQFRDDVFNQNVDLDGINIEGRLSVARSTFLGWMDATSLTVTGTVAAQGSCFLYPNGTESSPTISLQDATIGGSLLFNGSILFSPVDFANAVVRGALDFRNVTISKGHGSRLAAIGFDGVRVEGPAVFDGSHLDGCLSMEIAQFSALNLSIDANLSPSDACSGFVRPHPRGLNVDGMYYQRVIGGPETFHPMALLFWNLQRPSEAEASFAPLEAAAAGQGYRESADDVHIEHQRWKRAYRQRINGWRVWPLIAGESIIVDAYIGYGRKPLRALGVCVALILAASLLFAVAQLRGAFPPTEEPFLYSVTCFFPKDPRGVDQEGIGFSPWTSVGIICYMLLALFLFGVLIYWVSGASWAAVISFIGVALVPSYQRGRRLWIQSRTRASSEESGAIAGRWLI